MENILDHIEPEESDINENNLLIKIWYKPKETLKFILEYYPDKYVRVLLFLAGVGSTLQSSLENGIGGSVPEIIGGLFAILLLGGISGWVSYFIYAWAMSLTGNWLQGKAEPHEFRTVLAWALVPVITLILVIILEIAAFGIHSFANNFYQANEVLLLIFGIISIILSIWSVVILVIGIMIIQQFGVLKAILNMLLPIITLVAFFIGIFYILGL